MNRLLAERTEAHRRYNEALSAVDRAIQATAQWPAPPPAYDEQKLPAINDSWTILADGLPARPAGLNGKAFDAVWPAIKPVFERQMAFNAALVEHLNRNAAAHRQAHAAIAQALPALRDSFEALVTLNRAWCSSCSRSRRSPTRTTARSTTPSSNSARDKHRATRCYGGAAGSRGAPGAQVRRCTGCARCTRCTRVHGRMHTVALPYVGFEDRFRGSEERSASD